MYVYVRFSTQIRKHNTWLAKSGRAMPCKGCLPSSPLLPEGLESVSSLPSSGSARSLSPLASHLASLASLASPPSEDEHARTKTWWRTVGLPILASSLLCVVVLMPGWIMRYRASRKDAATHRPSLSDGWRGRCFFGKTFVENLGGSGKGRTWQAVGALITDSASCRYHALKFSFLSVGALAVFAYYGYVQVRVSPVARLFPYP